MSGEQERTDLNSRLMASKPRTSRAPRSSGAVRVKPVRITTDLGAAQHRALKDFCDQLAADAGLARVPGSEVVRVLLDQLHEDPELKQNVTDEIIRRGHPGKDL
ncbi:hypothetical protein CIK66_10475 [Brachybacterium alimentarium]|uniref:Uncharacterized protein n=1 Tax=Brachybacterium alimentarium TaxID=47845 RepID=A0A2A3YII4_9MICO|nr:hypothetical protein [Brachybacterium alimentarium]PCC39104.1 hypothetical protein CIK66_10475 [Brachybacterium alimentarium]